MDNQNINHTMPNQSETVNPQMKPNMPEPKSNKKVWTFFGIFGFFLIIAAVVYFIIPKSGQDIIKKNAEEIYKPAVALATKFSTYEEEAVNISPKIPDYSVNKDLNNVINAKDFTFSEEAKNLLVKNAFVVKPSYNNEFFPLYESNRYSYTPSFITTDSMLHNYHLMFDFILKQLEEQKLIAELKQLNAAMLSESLEQYNILKGTEWENAAKRNVGFFAVGSILLDSSVVVPAIVTNEVNKELALIEAHQGIEKSPVMNIGSGQDTMIDSPQGPQSLEALKEDYSQYIPRGHYDKTEQLKAYFKAMMWYGRLTFRMKNNDEVKSALLITLVLNNKDNQNIWNKIYEPVNFFVGKSDDITYYHFKDLVDKIYANATIQTISSDKNKFVAFIDETNNLEPPQINSIPIFNTAIQPDREKEIKGFRFMGQRFTIDAAIFQRLVTREVGPKGESCSNAPFTDGRMLPNGLDIPSAMGSGEAINILKNQGETQHACYPENISKMQTYLSGLPKENWTQNLYWGWLHQLRPLLDEKSSGYPAFMQNTAWARKELNTFLGSWSQLKHDTILYAKQVYAEMGAGGIEEKDDRGYVEPNPYIYARLASLLKMTNKGLEMRGLLTSNMKDNLSKMEQLAMSFKTISEKELNNEKLTDEEYELIRSYGGQLEHFWLEVNKDEPTFKESTGQRDYLNENPAAIISDVATDPNGQVLEVGTGKISEIYAVVLIDGKLRIAKGGVYSYYEFKWPMSDRLTDKKWRDLLNSGQSPQMPEWTNEFVAE